MDVKVRAALTLIVCDPYAGLVKDDLRCGFCDGTWFKGSFVQHAPTCPIDMVRRWLHTDEAKGVATLDVAEAEIAARQAEVDRYVEERRESIRQGARRSKGRFRLEDA